MKLRFSYLIGLVVLLGGCGTSRDEVRQIMQDELSKSVAPRFISSGKTIGPYSPAIRVGNFLFLSGQIALDPETGNMNSENIEVETRQVLKNIGRLLHTEGYDSSNVISATVYLCDMNNFAKMNTVYGSYFPEGKYPVRTTVGVADLPKQANIEITVIAYKAPQP